MDSCDTQDSCTNAVSVDSKVGKEAKSTNIVHKTALQQDNKKFHEDYHA